MASFISTQHTYCLSSKTKLLRQSSLSPLNGRQTQVCELQNHCISGWQHPEWYLAFIVRCVSAVTARTMTLSSNWLNSAAITFWGSRLFHPFGALCARQRQGEGGVQKLVSLDWDTWVSGLPAPLLCMWNSMGAQTPCGAAQQNRTFCLGEMEELEKGEGGLLHVTCCIEITSYRYRHEKPCQECLKTKEKTVVSRTNKCLEIFFGTFNLGQMCIFAFNNQIAHF